MDEELRTLIEDTAAQTRRHFDTVAERLEKSIDAVAESVTVVDEKLSRRIDRFEERVERGFAETQAMIKFSHADLDRRISSLEHGFAGLQARFERLESTPE